MNKKLFDEIERSILNDAFSGNTSSTNCNSNPLTLEHLQNVQREMIEMQRKYYVDGGVDSIIICDVCNEILKANTGIKNHLIMPSRMYVAFLEICIQNNIDINTINVIESCDEAHLVLEQAFLYNKLRAPIKMKPIELNESEYNTLYKGELKV